MTSTLVYRRVMRAVPRSGLRRLPYVFLYPGIHLDTLRQDIAYLLYSYRYLSLGMSDLKSFNSQLSKFQVVQIA